MTADLKNLGSGAVFVLGGMILGFEAYTDLAIGTALRMGPGFFPLMLAFVLVIIGLIVIAQGFGRETEAMPPIPWRAFVLVTAAPVVFALTIRGLGFIATVAITLIIATYASSRTTLRVALANTVGITIFCIVVFVYALGLPFALVGPWIGG